MTERQSLTVEQAADQHVCRICRRPVSAVFVLDYGREFAHEECLRAAPINQEDLVERLRRSGGDYYREQLYDEAAAEIERLRGELSCGRGLAYNILPPPYGTPEKIGEEQKETLDEQLGLLGEVIRQQTEEVERLRAELAARVDLTKITPSNADLLAMAERSPAPQEWYDEADTALKPGEPLPMYAGINGGGPPVPPAERRRLALLKRADDLERIAKEVRTMAEEG